MEKQTGRFEADGLDGRARITLVFTRLTAETGGGVASERMPAAGGLRGVAHGPGLYSIVLVGASLSRRPAAEGTMPERREGPAHPAPTSRLFRVEAPSGATAAYAVLEEASATGVRLLAGRPCSPGPAILVPLSPHPLAGRRFPFRVARSSAHGGGDCTVAGRFDPPITDEEARALAGVGP
jgi:hypothetical protein